MGTVKARAIVAISAALFGAYAQALDPVSRGASDARYLREDLKDSESNLRDAKREYAKCKSSLREAEAAFKIAKRNFDEAEKKGLSELRVACQALCSTNCGEDDLKEMKIYRPDPENLCKEIIIKSTHKKGEPYKISRDCVAAVQEAQVRGCGNDPLVFEPPINVADPANLVAQWRAHCDDLESVVEDAQEEVEDLKTELAAARKACPNCELLEQMKPRTPGTFDYVLGALQTLAPTALQGMAMNTWSGMIKDNAEAWASMYGRYTDYCAATGNPCMGPWSMMGYGGGWGSGWGGGSPFGSGGGFGGGFGGGGFVQNPFGPVGGMNGVPLGGNFTGGGFSPLTPGMPGGFSGVPMNAGGMINGWGSPVSPFGTGFNSAVFPTGAWAGTGISMYGMPMTDFGMSGFGMGAGLWGGGAMGSGLWLGGGGLGGFGGGTGLNLWGGLNFNAGLNF